MKQVTRRAIIVGLAGAAAAPLVGRNAAEAAVSSALPSRASIIATLRRVNDHWIGAHPDAGDLRWPRATLLSGDLALYRATREPRYLKYATSWAEGHNYGVWQGTATRNADNQCAGQVYYDLNDLVPDPAKVAAINKSITGMVHGTQPAKVDDWWWVDALHMAMPVFVRTGIYLKDDAYLQKLWNLYSYPKHTLKLYDYPNELWYRDATFTPPEGKKSPSGKPIFWSRGNGWAMAAHAKTLGLLPAADRPRWPEYTRNLGGLARSLAKAQRSDGFWNVNLADPAHFGGPETSGTSMFVFGLAYGIRAGILDRATYLPVACRAWNGMVAKAVHSDGFLGYVQDVGSEPASSQPVTVDTTSDFAVGAFLLGGTELAKLAR